MVSAKENEQISPNEKGTCIVGGEMLQRKKIH